MKQITKVRKTVCAMANQLRKAGYSLKDAFKKAWQRVKMSMTVRAEGKDVNDSSGSRNHI